MNKEICWNITAMCNQNCRYCHRFLNVKNLTFEDNEKILNKLINSGINEITWTGGEALLFPGIDVLLKIAFENGIKNKVITNGKVLTNERIDKIIGYIDSLTLSIDTLNNKTNEFLGRGLDHYVNIDRILNYIKEKQYNVNIKINTVLGKFNIDGTDDLVSYLNQYNIYSWRLFKFMPLREKAIQNKDEFAISSETYKNMVEKIKSNSNISNIEYREESDMEKQYVLILADGSIVITENGIDKTKGNALYNSVLEYI